MAAVIVRFSVVTPSPLSKSSSSGILPRRLSSLNRNPSRESMIAISSPWEKMKIQFLSKSSKSSQNTSCNRSTTSMEDVRMDVLEETGRLGIELSYSCKSFLEYISNFKGLVPSFTKTLLIANVSSMIFPFRALAETYDNGNSIFNMPLLFGIAMIGATVGGLLARQRRGELAKLNDQLRQINAALRRQAKIESYAPNLSYAPVSRVPETEVIVDPRKEQLITKLRTGKKFLRNHDPEKAFVEFEAAFELADGLGDHVEKKKAARGLGASLQRQGKYREAIKYHSKILEISQKAGESSGSTEAYGAIADCYTELGDLERAGKFYDKYIARLETD